MKLKISRYSNLIIEARRIHRFIKLYFQINLFFVRQIGFKKLGLSQFIDFMSIFRFYKLFLIFRLCSKINFEMNIGVRSKLINNLTIALDLINISNVDEDACRLYIKVSGWVKYLYSPIISSKFFNFKTNLRRWDVFIKQGQKNLYSGFEGIIDINYFKDIVWEVPSKNNTFMKGKLTPTRDIATLFSYDLQKSSEYDVDSAGFIDRVEIFWSLTSVANNLDFLIFASFVSSERLDFALKHVDHPLIEKFYAIVASRAFNYLKIMYINTSVAKKIESFVPNSSKVEFFKYRVQSDTSPRIIRLSNVRVLKSKFVVDEGGHIVNEFANSLNSDFLSGVNFTLFNDFHNESVTGCFTSSEYIFLDKAMLLPSLTNSNWFHFIVESLAILVWFKDKLPKEYPILLEHGTHDNIVYFLKLFDFNNIIFIHNDTEIRVKDLITFSKSAFIVDSVTKDLNSYEINSELMLNLKDKILNLYNFTHAENSKKILFFSRRKNLSRSLSLKRIDSKLIKRSGFEFIFPEIYSVRDQIYLYSKADILILEGGASLSNFLFSNSHCKILYLTNSLLGDYKLPKDFSLIFGLDLQILTGRIKFLSVWRASSAYDLFHSNYSISYFKLKRFLNKLERN